MLYGLAGSSGTGKTTLAKRIAAELDITYMPTSITECAKRHGFDPVGILSLQDRIVLQLHLLQDHLDMLDAAPRPLIVDRTPIDFIGYMMAEVDMNSHLRLSAEEIERIEQYKRLCQTAAVKHYDAIFMLGQLDTYEVANTRPAANRAYQTHSQLVMLGALTELSGRLDHVVLRVTDLEQRVEFLHDTIAKRLDEIQTLHKSTPYIH
ncbi:AAA family ATPase [Ancylobacter rudongensis]|uniref:AAA domain-containing protein n=1 Tax=Ancylobacter rudongensis TaxID=177413 RepID=A0A1G4UQI8_9HYPH|nr:AAA family ATPase [Ancylobacter rudongensis]SCW95921.1 AAA domain-containing protein [Ancylobacter rudongensis]